MVIRPYDMEKKEKSKNASAAGYIAAGLLVMLLFGITLMNFIYFRYGNEDTFDEIIAEKAAAVGVDPLLIKAIIKRESQFKFRCVGSKGEVGLMQLMPGAIRDWEEANDKSYHLKNELFAPELNIEIGSWYFARALRQWQNSANPEAYALAQYNAGRGNLLKWVKKSGKGSDYNKVVAFPSTRKYIAVILESYKDYKAEESEKNGKKN
jgi:soluble lytic murein transglycosylase